MGDICRVSVTSQTPRAPLYNSVLNPKLPLLVPSALPASPPPSREGRAGGEEQVAGSPLCDVGRWWKVTLQAPAHVPLSLTKLKFKDKNYYESQDEDCGSSIPSTGLRSVLSMGVEGGDGGLRHCPGSTLIKAGTVYLEAFLNF